MKTQICLAFLAPDGRLPCTYSRNLEIYFALTICFFFPAGVNRTTIIHAQPNASTMPELAIHPCTQTISVNSIDPGIWAHCFPIFWPKSGGHSSLLYHNSFCVHITSVRMLTLVEQYKIVFTSMYDGSVWPALAKRPKLWTGCTPRFY